MPLAPKKTRVAFGHSPWTGLCGRHRLVRSLSCRESSVSAILWAEKITVKHPPLKALFKISRIKEKLLKNLRMMFVYQGQFSPAVDGRWTYYGSLVPVPSAWKRNAVQAKKWPTRDAVLYLKLGGSNYTLSICDVLSCFIMFYHVLSWILVIEKQERSRMVGWPRGHGLEASTPDVFRPVVCRSSEVMNIAKDVGVHSHQGFDHPNRQG